MPRLQTSQVFSPVFDNLRILLREVDDCTVQLRREDLIIEIFEIVADNVAEILKFPNFAQVICTKLQDWEQCADNSGEARVFARFKFLLDDLQCAKPTLCYKN